MLVFARSAFESQLGHPRCEDEALCLALLTTQTDRFVDAPKIGEREVDHAQALGHAVAVSVSKTMDEDRSLEAANGEAMEAVALLSQAIQDQVCVGDRSDIEG